MAREREGSERPEKPCMLDANVYATRKTVAQGMMDIALLTANASQLKHVLATSESHDYYTINLVLIGTSMTLQILVGILLVMVGRWNINKRKDQRNANSMNNSIVILIFLITVVNVLITAFSDDDVVIYRDVDKRWSDNSPLSDAGRGLKMSSNNTEP